MIFTSEPARSLARMRELGIRPTLATLAAGFGLGPGVSLGTTRDFALNSLTPETSADRAADVIRLAECTDRHSAHELLLKLAEPFDRAQEVERWACAQLSLLLDSIASSDLEPIMVACEILDLWDQFPELEPPFDSPPSEDGVTRFVTLHHQWLTSKLQEVVSDQARSHT